MFQRTGNVRTSDGTGAFAVPGWLRRFWRSFSGVGLALGTLFFAASLTPSLIPRGFFVQGMLSGLCFSIGYGLGHGHVYAPQNYIDAWAEVTASAWPTSEIDRLKRHFDERVQ